MKAATIHAQDHVGPPGSSECLSLLVRLPAGDYEEFEVRIVCLREVRAGLDVAPAPSLCPSSSSFRSGRLVARRTFRPSEFSPYGVPKDPFGTSTACTVQQARGHRWRHGRVVVVDRCRARAFPRGDCDFLEHCAGRGHGWRALCLGGRGAKYDAHRHRHVAGKRTLVRAVI